MPTGTYISVNLSIVYYRYFPHKSMTYIPSAFREIVSSFKSFVVIPNLVNWRSRDNRFNVYFWMSRSTDRSVMDTGSAPNIYMALPISPISRLVTNILIFGASNAKRSKLSKY